MAELQAALDKLQPGTSVKMTFKSMGKETILEGVSK